MLEKNSFWLGIGIGLLFPAILFGLLFLVNLLTGIFSHPPVLLSFNKLMFISLALNILPIRYYFIHGNVENTGKGILVTTVVLIILVTVVFR
jgi:hypothetical protein